MLRKSVYSLKIRKTSCNFQYQKFHNCLKFCSVSKDNIPPTKCQPFSDIPQPPYSLPFIGTVWHYRLGMPHYSIPKIQSTLRHFYDTMGPLVRETIHGEEVVHVFDPDDIRTVYSSEGKVPHIIPLLPTIHKYRQSHNFPLGVGNMNGEDWYKLRTVVTKLMMRPRVIYNYLSLEQEVTDDWIAEIKRRRNPVTGEVENMNLQLSKWSYETSAYNVIDHRFHSLGEDDPNSEVHKLIAINNHMFQKSTKFKYSMLPWLRMFPTTPLWQNFKTEENYFYKVVLGYLDTALIKLQSYISAVEEGQETLNELRFLFLRYMVSNENLSKGDIMITGQSLFTDGLSTTAPTAAAMLYFLASHPEEQNKLYAEISSSIGSDPGIDAVTIDNLSQLPHVKAFIKEVFRFFPIQPGISRITDTDLILSGFHIPKGTNIFLSNGVHLLDSKHFQDPLKFSPSRWLRDSDNTSTNIHPFIMLPFSHGPRTCLGRRFAEQELYLLLIKLVQSFEVELLESSTSCFEYSFQMLNIPDKPLKIAFHPRKI